MIFMVMNSVIKIIFKEEYSLTSEKCLCLIVIEPTTESGINESIVFRAHCCRPLQFMKCLNIQHGYWLGCQREGRGSKGNVNMIIGKKLRNRNK